MRVRLTVPVPLVEVDPGARQPLQHFESERALHRNVAFPFFVLGLVWLVLVLPSINNPSALLDRVGGWITRDVHERLAGVVGGVDVDGAHVVAQHCEKLVACGTHAFEALSLRQRQESSLQKCAP